MGSVVHAPEIDRPGLQWFNVPRPLSLADLAGKLVILDFWTFCCINCMHIIPILQRIEEAFPNEVVVIGVHSPKFAAERDPANVVKAIARYGIRHPVVHDPDHVLWREFAVRAWPTLTFISPDGYVIGQVSGEPDPQKLMDVVAKTIAEGKAEGELRPSPLTLAPLEDAEATGHLRFPGKIKALPRGDEAAGWVLADSGNHRIVLVDMDGKVRRIVGTGKAGFADGDSKTASFNSPQGLVATSDAIYVADTFNHALRKIDVASGQVTTLAGNGRRGRGLGAPVAARDATLASPWDVELSGARLYFANAGTHQLGVLDLTDDTVARLAGSGAEAITDGPAAEAALAQPSGLALSADRTQLYFADSETSAARVLDLESGMVHTLVGKGLFAFGHRNGPFDEALLQHPLGIAVLDEHHVVVADSYNNALRLLDLRVRRVADLDDGFTCLDPVCYPLGEPAAVTADGDGRLLVSDTNNHRILDFDLAQRTYKTWFR